jgi:hypothetical protein
MPDARRGERGIGRRWTPRDSMGFGGGGSRKSKVESRKSSGELQRADVAWRTSLQGTVTRGAGRDKLAFMRQEYWRGTYVLTGIALLLLAGCRELEGFSTAPGEAYRGSIVASLGVTVDGGETDIDPIRRGIDIHDPPDGVEEIFGPDTTMEMTLRVEEFQTSNVARATTSDGLLVDAQFQSIEKLWNDTLSGFSFPSGRLRSGLYFVEASAAAPASLAGREILAVLSLMVDGSVEVRLISGANRLYGVFRLRKTTSSEDGGPDVTTEDGGSDEATEDGEPDEATGE